MSSSPPLARLYSLNERYHHHQISKRSIVLGKAVERCDIVVSDPFVSRKHMCIKYNPASSPSDTPFTIIDLASKNGIYVWNPTDPLPEDPNQTKLEANTYVSLHHGSVISIGVPFRHSPIQASMAADQYGERKSSDGRDVGVCTYKGPAYIFESLVNSESEIIAAEVDHHTKVYQHYRFGRKLGNGAFGVVYYCISAKTSMPVAAKVIDKKKLALSGGSTQDIDRELDVMNQLRNPHICEIRDAFDTPSYLIMFMELLTGGDLGDYIKSHGPFMESEVSSMFLQILSGLQYLHGKDICHRDLKPDNIMLQSPPGQLLPVVLKITDFGLSKQRVGRNLSTVCGTPLYMAPELFRGEQYDERVDMWSAGCILYELLTGQRAFAGSTMQQIAQQITGFANLPMLSVSAPCQTMLSQLIADPQVRWSASVALQSPWFHANQPRPVDPRMGESATLDYDAVSGSGRKKKRRRRR